MSEPIDHHFIPQFYLRRWASGIDSKLWEIRNFNGIISRCRRSPKGTGHLEHLYSYSEKYHAANRAEIETKFFKLLDDAGAKFVAKFINNRQLTKREKIRWAQFLSAMRVRMPENVQKIKSYATSHFISALDLGDDEYQPLKEEGDPQHLKDWVELKTPGLIESIGVRQIPKIVSNPQVLRDILAMDWFALDTQYASKPLLSSDRPCIYTAGLQNPDCIIALPLTPTHAFFAFRKGSRAHRALMTTPVSKIVKAINCNVVAEAKERVYCINEFDVPDNFLLRYLKSSS